MKIKNEFKDNIINLIDDYEKNQQQNQQYDIKLDIIDYMVKNTFENNLDFNGKFCIIINRNILNLLKQILDIYIRCGLLQLDYALYPFLQHDNIDVSKIDKLEIMYLLKQVRNKLIDGTMYDNFKFDMSDWCIDEHSKHLPLEMNNAISFLETIQYFDKEINDVTNKSDIIITELKR